jgi:hypothetical protein
MIQSTRRSGFALSVIGAALAILVCAIAGDARAAASIKSLEHLLLRQGAKAAFDRGDSFTNLGRVPCGHTTCVVYHSVHIDVNSPYEESQAVVLVTEKGIYFGLYDIDNDVPPSKVSSSHDIVYNLPAKGGNMIHFEPGGPLKSVLIGGQRFDFLSAADSRCLMNPSCPRHAALRHHDSE